MVTDNAHDDRCPHADFIKGILTKKGFTNVVEGSYISGGASRKREIGIYKDYKGGCYESF
jgi:hypothetical protein